MGNSASSLPYSIGKQVSTVNEGWALHEGSRKSDGADVSVFCAKKPALSKTVVNKRAPHMTQLLTARHHFQQCKKLRHPHILQVYATLDTDNPTEGAAGAAPTGPPKPETGDFIVVTEPCVSLETWLQTNPPPEQIAWGLEAVIRALHFLHASANLAHGNLSPGSFFVTPAGDVKLWNFSLVTGVENGRLSRHFTDWEGLITPDPYRSPERREGRWDALGVAGVHTMDSYAMGILIPHFFQGQLPQPLVKAVQRLQTPNLKMRPRLQPLLKCPVFDTPYQKIQLQLEEFTVQPVEQKIAFWQNLTANMQAGLLPENLAVHKLMPLIQQSIQTICQSDSMRAQDMYRREVLSTIPPMFYIADTYLGDKASKEIGSLVSILFTVNDRAIRGSLLQKVGFLSTCLDKNTLNQAVFERACSGFSDSSSALRELTLKATLELVPQLTQPNLEKLSRYLVRLQTDSEASIRTNTVLVFAKLAPHLTEMSRQKMLLPAFVRAMKDPFVPCRLSALKCTLKAKEFFDPQGIASTVLPAVTPQLLDPVKDVRREAFTVVDDLMFFLRQESERMPSAAPAVEAPLSAGSSHQPRAAPAPAKSAADVAPAPSSGGYLSGISSWMSSSTKPSEAGGAAPAAQQAPPRTAPPAYQSTAPSNAVSSLTVEDFSDGWGDDDDAVALDNRIKTEVSPAHQAKIMFGAPPPAMTGDDDLFGDFDSKPAKPVIMKSSAGKLAVPKKQAPGSKVAAPAVQKLSVDEDVSDGWDDF